MAMGIKPFEMVSNTKKDTKRSCLQHICPSNHDALPRYPQSLPRQIWFRVPSNYPYTHLANIVVHGDGRLLLLLGSCCPPPSIPLLDPQATSWIQHHHFFSCWVQSPFVIHLLKYDSDRIGFPTTQPLLSSPYVHHYNVDFHQSLVDYWWSLWLLVELECLPVTSNEWQCWIPQFPPQ